MRSPARLAPLLVLALACPSLRPASETRSVPHTNPTPPRPEPPETMRGWELPSGRYLLEEVSVRVPGSPVDGLLFADGPMRVQRDPDAGLYVEVTLEGRPLRLAIHDLFALSACLRAPKRIREAGFEWHLGAGTRVYLRGPLPGERMRIALAPWPYAPTYILPRNELTLEGCLPRWPMQTEQPTQRCLHARPDGPTWDPDGVRLSGRVELEVLEEREHGRTKVRVTDPRREGDAPPFVEGWLEPGDSPEPRVAALLTVPPEIEEGWPDPSQEAPFEWDGWRGIHDAAPDRVAGYYSAELDQSAGVLLIPGSALQAKLDETPMSALDFPSSLRLGRAVMPAGGHGCFDYSALPRTPSPPTQTPSDPAPTPTPVGSLSKARIRAVIREHIGEVRHCYERQLNYTPDLEGRVTFRFVIGPDGGVGPVRVRDRSPEAFPPWVEHCIASRMRAWRFPAPEGEGLVVVNYPFALRTTG